ncbi:MAG: hypothetical protein K1X94_26680 [Sandaracinaceae bacterium]|nr:hypothetical protein [Sandaracinaceae bacterium]
MSLRSARITVLATLLFAGCSSDPPAADAATTPDAGAHDAPTATRDAPAPAACLSGTVCGIAPSTGCAGGQSCAYRFDTERTNECVTPGSGALGDACGTNADCSAGFSCLSGYCTEMCCPGEGSCSATTACDAVTLTASGDTIHVCLCEVGGTSCPAGHFCNPLGDGTRGTCLAQGTCNRLTQDCPGAQGCYGTVRECAPAGTAAVGAPCMDHHDCVPGAWCRAAGGTTECASYCDASAADTCPMGTHCVSFADDEPNVGGCYPL